MTDVNQLITEHLDIWTSAIEKKSSAGRGNGGAISLHGIKKLRDLILELAVQGKLVAQNPAEGNSTELLEAIEQSRQDLVKQNKVKIQKGLSPVAEEEYRFSLPNGWAWTRLSSLAEISPRNDVEDSTLVSFVPMPDIHTSHTGKHDFSERRWAEIKKSYTHFADGDIALAKITPCFENSKAAVFSNLHDGVGAGTTELHVARPHSKEVVPRFILLHLKAPSFLENGKAVMTGSAGQKRVPRWYFSDTPIALPPTAEQHRIVAKVDELMGLCDTLEAQATDSLKAHQTLVQTCLAALTNSQTPEDLAQNWARLEANFDALFTTDESIKSLREAILEWAVRGLLSKTFEADTDPNEFLQNNLAARSELQKETGDARLKKCANTLFEEYRAPLPAGWSAASFDELFLFIDYRGRTPKKTESGTPLITAKNVRMGQLNREPREYVSGSTYVEWMTRGFPRIGDLFFTTEAPLANVCINDIDEPFALAQRVICLQPISQINTRYLEIAIRSKPVQEMIDRNGTGMTAKGIKASKLKPLAIPFPPIEEQDRIVDKVQQLDTICASLASSLKQAEDTKLNLADGLVRQASEVAA